MAAVSALRFFRTSRIVLVVVMASIVCLWVTMGLLYSVRVIRSNDFSLLDKEVESTLRHKSAAVITASNWSNLVIPTLSRVVARMPDGSLTGYIYEKDVVRVKYDPAQRLIHVHDIVTYLRVEQEEDGVAAVHLF